jgi:hypothetical protein
MQEEGRRVALQQTRDQSVDAAFMVGVAVVDDDVGFWGGFGDNLRGVIVAFDDLDFGVFGCEGVRDIAEEDGDGVFGVGWDEAWEDAATDIARGASTRLWLERGFSNAGRNRKH